MSKTSAKILIGMWSAVLAVCIALFTFLSVNGGWLNLPFWNNARYGGDWSYHTVHEQSLADDVHSLQLDWKAGDILVRRSEDGNVKIVQLGVKNTPENQFFRAAANNGVLTISEGPSRAGLRIGPFSYSIGSDLELYLPEKVYESVRLTGSNGDVFLESLDASSLKISTSSGEISLSGSVQKLDLSSNSGDILCHDLQAEQITCRTTSGDMDFSGELKEIDAVSTSGELSFYTSRMVSGASLRSTSGDVTLSLPENDGFDARFSTTSGDLHCDFSGPFREGSQDFQYQGGGPQITVQTTIGDAALLRS